MTIDENISKDKISTNINKHNLIVHENYLKNIHIKIRLE